MPDGGQHYPALVLNADFRPLSYFPLSVWSWQDAVKAVFLDRVSVLSEYDTEVHSPSMAFRLPSVIALKDYIPSARKPAFTRFNVFLRDAFSCQYCGERFPTHDLTFDHVIPRSRGGAHDMGKRGDGLRVLQSSQGQQAAARVQDVSPPDAVPAEHLGIAGERAGVSAELSACELAGLSLLG